MTESEISYIQWVPSEEEITEIMTKSDIIKDVAF